MNIRKQEMLLCPWENLTPVSIKPSFLWLTVHLHNDYILLRKSDSGQMKLSVYYVSLCQMLYETEIILIL